MNILIAIGIALLAVIVLVALLKLAFNLTVLGAALFLAVVAYFAAEKLLGKGR